MRWGKSTIRSSLCDVGNRLSYGCTRGPTQRLRGQRQAVVGPCGTDDSSLPAVNGRIYGWASTASNHSSRHCSPSRAPPPLTAAIAELERTLEDCRGEEISGRLSEAELSEALLQSALYARAEFGRINDVIHAVAIALTLPRLLKPGERLKRPSLAARERPTSGWPGMTYVIAAQASVI
jgi:hypothetical protein